MKRFGLKVLILIMLSIAFAFHITLLSSCSSPEQASELLGNSNSQTRSHTSPVTSSASMQSLRDSKKDLRALEAAERSSMVQQIRNSGARASDTEIKVVLDFLIQDVCMDAQGLATTEDPARCSLRRNITSGEALPYTKIDAGPHYPASIEPGWQRSDSVPFRDKRGRWNVIKTFDFGGPCSVPPKRTQFQVGKSHLSDPVEGFLIPATRPT